MSVGFAHFGLFACTVKPKTLLLGAVCGKIARALRRPHGFLCVSNLGEKDGHHGEVRSLWQNDDFRTEPPLVEEIDAPRSPPQPAQSDGVGKRAQGAEDGVHPLPADDGEDQGVGHRFGSVVRRENHGLAVIFRVKQRPVAGRPGPRRCLPGTGKWRWLPRKRSPPRRVPGAAFER